VNATSHSSTSTASASPGPLHEPPPDSTTTPIPTSTAPATAYGDGRLPRSAGATTASTSGLAPSIAAMKPGVA
jgi:hypothetical protein